MNTQKGRAGITIIKQRQLERHGRMEREREREREIGYMYLTHYFEFGYSFS